MRKQLPANDSHTTNRLDTAGPGLSSSRRTSRRLAPLIVVPLLAAACSNGDDAGSSGETTLNQSESAEESINEEPIADEPAPAETEVTGSSEASTSTTAAPEDPEPEEASFNVTSDVVYLTMDGINFGMDIYTPSGDGPWPVVLNYHGLGTKNDFATTVVSEAAALSGMLVYTPSWVGAAPPFSAEVFDGWKDRASCSVAFAQQHAATNGGDPASTVLYGFSAGAGPVLFATHQPKTEPIDGCATDELPTPPVGAILGDGEYLLYSREFDKPFADDPTGMQQELAGLVDPANWPTDLDVEFFMWIPENETSPRSIKDTDTWLAMRDPDGSIRADLEQLGMLDDGFISTRDAARLLELRLSNAGYEVTVDQYRGGHTTPDKVPELVGYMQSALEN